MARSKPRILYGFLYGYLWDLLQVFLGADKGIQSLHMQTIAPTKRARILDFGCSTGNASAIFKGYDYTGLDIDPVVIDFARHKFRNHPSLKFVCQDILTLQDAEKFDAIICGSVGHHIPNEQFLPILVKFKDLLKPGGYLGVFDPVTTGTEGWLLRWVMRHDQGKSFKSYDEYLKLFDASGWQVVEAGIANVKGLLLDYTNYAWFKLKPRD
jgi:SAM-dependent methyltransferase